MGALERRVKSVSGCGQRQLATGCTAPDLAERFPLILSCAKSLWFRETQHRNLPSLRRSASGTPVELHPSTARARGIIAGPPPLGRTAPT
jgi:anaerobic selenocysteine-containing dehydrogenase